MRATRFLWVLMLASGLALATNIDGTITYQAQIKQNGSPANGTFDFQFKLFDSATVGVGAQRGQTVPVNDVAIVNGQLSTNLNFDNPATPFDGTELFLEVGIRPGNSQPNDPYTLLNPRQRLTEVPYSTHTLISELAMAVPSGSITSTQLAANSVGSSNIIDGSVGTADLAAGAVTSAKIDSSTVQTRVSGTCPAGNAVTAVAANGTVSCAAISGGGGGGGTVTSVGTSSGLTGGTITTTGVIGIANLGVTNAMIADGTITGAKIAAATITGADIAPSTISNTNINAALVQQRVVGTCLSGAAVQTIGQDGSVTCVSVGGGSGGGWGLNGNALTGAEFLGDSTAATNGKLIQIRSGNQRVAQFQLVTDASSETGANVLMGSSANSISGGVTAATIGGGGFSAPAGEANSVTASGGTISGGFQNSVSALGGTVGGGFTNAASAQAAVVSGGSQNHASNFFAAVVGGTANVASGQFSAVLGGKGNTAGADYSATIGNCANVASTHTGAIVISARTASTCSPVGSSGANTVTVSAGSGGVVLNAGAGAWTSVSDRNVKHGVEPVNSEAILSGVLAMPVATWTYNSQSDGIRHMGPMAQDFYAAFSLGETELGINTVDADGVALAAIQGLNAKLERENAELKAKNADLETRLTRIEQTLLGTNGQAGR